MGSGARHGRRGHAARRRRVHQNRRRRRNRRNHRAHAHHNNGQNFHSHVIFGAVTRRGTNAQTSQTTQGVNITYYSSGTSSNGQSSAALAYVPMCRVFSVFLWFAGIMMMSLGGFRTPIGFVGVGCLVVGILMLIFTSLVISGSCAQRCQSNADPEQPAPTNPPEGNNQAFRPVRPVVATRPPDATPLGDSVPSYPGPDPASDKPPSYEEVMSGQYPPTISASVLPPIPEDGGIEPVLSQGMTASVPIMPPYPLNTPQGQHLGYPAIQPYPPVDAQSYQRTENERTSNPVTLYPPTAANTQLDHQIDRSYQVNATQSTVEGDSNQNVSSFVPQSEPIHEDVEPVMPFALPQSQVSPPISTSPLAQTSSSDTLPIVQVDTMQTLPLEPSAQNEALVNETSMHLSDSSTTASNSIEHSSHRNTAVITMINEVEGTANEGRTDLQSEYVDGLSRSMDATVSTHSHSEC